MEAAGSRWWYIGGWDAEMEEIAAVLRAAGERYTSLIHGTTPGLGSHAYAEPIDPPYHAEGRIYAVECGDDPLPAGVVRIDHHRPGDPGWDVPPAEYFRGSSLGQVCAILGQEVTAEQRMIAAADHCLAAAYRGECPGVDPEALGRWRAESQAKRRGCSLDAVLAERHFARGRLLSARPILLPGTPEYPVDLRPGRGTFCRHQCDCDGRGSGCWSMLPAPLGVVEDAAAIEHRSFVCTITPGPADGRAQVILRGALPRTVRGFMQWASSEEGLVDVYGAPERGFAGGYIPDGDGKESSK